ncbi:hypothetical protein SELMODRAFT_418837 [Selaginella moellendorffii]|uniref:Pectinesterase inhibitor domain-containing protein n=1 Tax=Selaginella moellendorffii TaxID=88036 RepID=D8S6J2_SELML|nr:hypothetical protein SELMODRAFT_418837 [Selaginella moellendorffii]
MALSKSHAVSIALLAFFVCAVVSSDPDPLQDFCIGDFNVVPGINGFPCRNTSTVTVDDFIYSGIVNSSNTTNINRSDNFSHVLGKCSTLLTTSLLHLVMSWDLLGKNLGTRVLAGEIYKCKQASVLAAVVDDDPCRRQQVEYCAANHPHSLNILDRVCIEVATAKLWDLIDVDPMPDAGLNRAT